MPLQSLFTQQVDELRGFLRSSRQPLGILTVAGELRGLVLRLLARLDADESFPHVLLGNDVAFVGTSPYFTALSEQLAEEYQKHLGTLPQAELREISGSEFQPEPSAQRRFVALLTRIVEQLPHEIRSLVLVLSPVRVEDPQAYRAAMQELAQQTLNRRIRYLVFDDQKNPQLAGLPAESSRVRALRFDFEPSAIEQQLQADLRAPGVLGATERQQYASMLAGFSFSKGDYSTALSLYQQNLALLPSTAGSQAAAILYNIGNTYVASGQLALAEQSYARAVDLCVDHQQNGLLALVLINLGQCLQRLQRSEEAIRCLTVARDSCARQGSPVLEAQALGALAELHAQAKRPKEARACLQDCMTLFDKITSPAFADLRAAGRAEVLANLAKLPPEHG